MKKIFFLLIATAALIAVASSCSKTEYDFSSSLHGIITDSSTGEPIDNATITLSPGGRTTISGSDGQYNFVDLDPGEYKVMVQKEGYTTNRKSVTAVLGEAVRADIPLTPKN